VPEKFLTDRAQEPARYTAASAGTHNDEVGVLGLLDQEFCWMALGGNRLDGNRKVVGTYVPDNGLERLLGG
jgi:hypothetical protein